MRSRLPLRTATACLGIAAATASLLAMAPAQAHRTGHAPAGGSPHVITTIPVDRKPLDIAVDPVTDMIYVTEPAQLQVIDGKTNTVVATLHMVTSKTYVAVNPATDMIYVTDASQLSLLAIDGKTNTVVAQIKLAAAPFGIAVDPRTDRIYVRASPLQPDIHEAVINGKTNKVLTRIPTGSNFTLGAAADPQTDMIYVAAGEPNGILAINGQTNTVAATIPVTALAVADDPQTNTVYATIQTVVGGAGIVSVIDGQTATLTTTINVQDPVAIAADPHTGFVYVASAAPGDVTVINGRTNKVTATVPVGSLPQGVAADPRTNMVYAAVQGSSSVAVLAGAG